jgi:hypothetical protein
MLPNHHHPQQKLVARVVRLAPLFIIITMMIQQNPPRDDI